MGASSPVNISGPAHDGFPGSLGFVSSSIPGPHGNGLPASVDIHKPMLPGAMVGSAPAGTIVKPVPIAKNGKKRGMDHRCEMCNKVGFYDALEYIENSGLTLRSGLSSSILSHQASLGTHFPLARIFQVCVEQTSTGSAPRGSRHPVAFLVRFCYRNVSSGRS